METDAVGTGGSGERLSMGERPWTLPFILVAAIAIAGVLLALRQKPAGSAAENRGGWTPEAAAGAEAASLSIDVGNGARREFAALPWSSVMTVADVLEQARDFLPGIEFTQQGEGEMAMLVSLDGVVNDPAIGRFWIYDVDGTPGDVSFAVQRVEKGQRVHWVYSKKTVD
jgi:hypothetical protein